MKRSIQKKLVKSSMSVLITVFMAVIIVVSIIQVVTSSRNLGVTTTQLRKALEAKGTILVKNNSLALSGMVADNAFLGVQELVGRTVSEDPDVVYGVYMDLERLAWVNAKDSVPGKQEKASTSRQVLDDSISHWASKTLDVSFREQFENGKLHSIEFCNPVKVDGEVVGFIRYGFGTSAMLDAINAAKKSNRMALVIVLLVLVLLGAAAVSSSYFIITKQSKQISSPIIGLDKDAKIIAGGNYDIAIAASTDDEIGELAASFEEMRQKVKKYTDHLEEIVQEKMQQVRDILENIDQGLFTVNFDGSINGEYSRSVERMLQVEKLGEKTVWQALRLGSEDITNWKDWASIVQSRHQSMRWDKLTKIAPLQEMMVNDAKGRENILKFSYQKIHGKDGSVNKLMVLADDVTETRRIEKIIRDEQLKHENEVKTILGLVNNLPESISEFFNDLETRFTAIRKNLFTMRKESERARLEFPDGPNLNVDQVLVAEIFRDLHTIKGNAGSYGFELLTQIAHHAEEALERLRPPILERTLDTIALLEKGLTEMHEERKSIDETYKRLRGGTDGVAVAVAERKIEYIQQLANTLAHEFSGSSSNLFEPLYHACTSLRRVPLVKVADKYKNMALRVADKLSKKIEFQCTPSDSEIEPTFFSPFNEAIIHILRNSVDHGIEMPEIRVANGKPENGTIVFHFEELESYSIVEISDDGGGLDPQKIGSIASEKGFVTAESLKTMSDHDKIQLLYLPGFSTKKEVTDISGRGVGLDAVKNGIEALGGRIEMYSELGKGTKIRIEIPSVVSG